MKYIVNYGINVFRISSLRGFVLIGLMCRLKSVHESCAVFRRIFGRN